jgi:hypothetical protein
MKVCIEVMALKVTSLSFRNDRLSVSTPLETFELLGRFS